jgi:general secretion pathway protein E
MNATSHVLVKGAPLRENELSSGRLVSPPKPSNNRGKGSSPEPLRQLRPLLGKRLNELAVQFASDDEAHSSDRPEFALGLLHDALEVRASDIHLEPEESTIRVRLRIDGALCDIAQLPLQTGRCLTNQFKALAGLDPVARFTPKDSHFRFSDIGHSIDLRLALVPSQQGEAVSIRVLDSRRLERTLDDLGLSATKLQLLEGWLENVNGMFLAAGPTGSGKTTTVYALLHELKFRDRRIVSIEDPIEYAIPGITQVQLDEKHHLSFTEGVKAVLRLDPDFLMMGEIRDASSAHAAVDAAITGRALLSTVHSRDAVGAITALRNWGLPDHEIAESLAVVVAQRLVRKLCPRCRKSAGPSTKEKSWLHAVGVPVPKQCWVPNGCEQCTGIGYIGRTGVFELWHLSEADYQLILNHSDEHTLRDKFHELELGSLLLDGITKVETGVTSLEELRKASSGTFPSSPHRRTRPNSLQRRKEITTNI